LTRLLFPKDFTKGVSATVEEVRKVEFVEANSYIFQRSNILIACLRSDDLLRVLLDFKPEVDFSDGTNAEVLRALKSVVTLSPVDSDLSRLAKMLESRGATMKWATRGMVGNFKAAMLSFSHSLIKAYFGLTKGPDRFGAWWKLLFSSADYDALLVKDFTGINNSIGLVRRDREAQTRSMG
jgi:hypothetical protein